MPLRKRRCELITPAANRGMIEKSSELSVDQMILDLEDSVVEERKRRVIMLLQHLMNCVGMER